MLLFVFVAVSACRNERSLIFTGSGEDIGRLKQYDFHFRIRVSHVFTSMAELCNVTLALYRIHEENQEH